MSGELPLVKLIKGDITTFEGDALVNAANTHLKMEAGVSGAIKKKGSPVIEKEAIAKGPVAIGEAVVTGAGNLKCTYVIHAAVIGLDLKTEAEIIKKATLNALTRAEEKEIHSLAFPALGAGAGGLSFAECARAMALALERYFQEKTSSLKEIYFYLFTEEAFQAFQKVFLS